MKKATMCVCVLYKLTTLAIYLKLDRGYIYKSVWNDKYTNTVHTSFNKANQLIYSEYRSIKTEGIFDIDIVMGLGLFPYLKRRLSTTRKRQSAYVERVVNNNQSAKEKTAEALLDAMNETDRYIFENRDRL